MNPKLGTGLWTPGYDELSDFTLYTVTPDLQHACPMSKDEPMTKPWWASATLWTQFITIAVSVLAGLGAGIDPSLVAAITGLVAPVITVLLRIFRTNQPIATP